MNNEMKFFSFVAYLATNYLRWWDTCFSYF
jgi:hypothetical protein